MVLIMDLDRGIVFGADGDMRHCFSPFGFEREDGSGAAASSQELPGAVSRSWPGPS
jgi:hypothetical protein